MSTPASILCCKARAGFSLVEILVAMVIALLATLVIFQVFAISEGQKRTTTGGADAQQAGMLGLYLIERDVRMAGYGVNFEVLLGCETNAYYNGPPPRSPPEFTLTIVPLMITNGAAGAPDKIAMLFGNSDMQVAPAKLLPPNMPSPAANYKVDNRFGFAEGDLILGVEAGKKCTLSQVTGVPGAGASDNIVKNGGNYTNTSGQNVPAYFNKPGGLGVSYNAWDENTNTGGKVYNIGTLPTAVVYSLQNNRLLVTDSFSNVETELADNIVQMQAQYGKDTNNDLAVDTWEVAMPVGPTSADWARIIAVRLVFVARSALKEKANAAGICEITTVAPLWAGATVSVNNPVADPIVLTADPDWKCYRYRAFETTVPLRNLIWKPL